MRKNEIHCFVKLIMYNERLKLDSFCVTFRMNDDFAKIIDKIFRRKHDFFFRKKSRKSNSHDNSFETNFRVFAHFFEKSFVFCDTNDVKFRIALHSEITSIQNFERHYTYFDFTV